MHRVAASPCRIDTPFIHQFRGMGTDTIPRLDIQAAGAFQTYVGGPEQQASCIVRNAQVRPSLGRPISYGAANLTVQNSTSPSTTTA